MDRERGRERSWAIETTPSVRLYAHMPLPVLRSHNPGRRPRTPSQNRGPCSSLSVM